MNKKIAVICGGGSSSERDVSLRSGDAVFQALKSRFIAEKFELSMDELPSSILPQEYVVFPICHGEWGEDGQLQQVLEERGLSFAGSDSRSSALGMQKWQCKQVAIEAQIQVPHGLLWNGQDFETLWRELDGPFVVKPNDKGSSIGVHKIYSSDDFEAIRKELEKGAWLVENCIQGRELTVGILNGKALPIVEICAIDGFYDYQHKYTPGATNYFAPADVDAQIAQQIQRTAEKLFVAGGFRDFARMDFLLNSKGEFYFLEVNTSPGMTSSSLLPKAAAVVGLSFEDLCYQMLKPAIQRDSLKN